MEKNNIFKYILISCIIIIIYLITDFLNIFNFITKELNFESLAILINALVVVLVFLITYSLVNKKHLTMNKKIILIKGIY